MMGKGDWGPLVTGPATPAEFVSELLSADSDGEGASPTSQDPRHLAELISQQGANGGDVGPLLARARLLLGYAGEDTELLHDAGGAMSVAEMAAALDVPVGTVRTMIRAGELLAVRVHGAVALPRLQLDAINGRTVVLLGIPGIVAVAAELAAEGWHVLQWLVLPSPALHGRTPIEALRAGAFKAAAAAARAEI